MVRPAERARGGFCDKGSCRPSFGGEGEKDRVVCLVGDGCIAGLGDLELGLSGTFVLDELARRDLGRRGGMRGRRAEEADGDGEGRDSILVGGVGSCCRIVSMTCPGMERKELVPTGW